MKNAKRDNYLYLDDSVHSQSQVKRSSPEQKMEELLKACDETYPFYMVFKNVKDQIEFECFSPIVRDNIEDVCLIITEVLKLPPDALVRIAGNNLPAEMVQAIYHRLTHEHIELVMENFGRATYEIKHKKTYLRTALYNSVFEFNVHYENAVNTGCPPAVKEPFGKRGGKNK